MGTKTWMLVYADDHPAEALSVEPELDYEGTLRLAGQLLPDESLEDECSTDLWDTNPAKNRLCIGQFPGVAVVAAIEFGLDRPSELPERFLRAYPAKHVFLCAMHSGVDWFAYAHWRDGALARSLSVSPDGGFIENIGAPLEFERPFWDGVDRDDDVLPFHPLELGEAARLALFGFQAPWRGASAFEPEHIELLSFVRGGPLLPSVATQLEFDFSE